MKQTSRGLAPSLNTGHSTFNGARQRLAVALVAIVIAFAGAQTAGAQTLGNVRFDIRGEGTVKLQREGQWLEVTNKQTIPCLIPSVSALTITPETDYVVPSITCDATDGLSIDLYQIDDFQWSLNIHPYGGSDRPTITVHIVFDKGLAGGDDEASAVALTADNDLSHLAGGWYKVESDLTFGHTVNLHGDTHITIATGATLTVSTSGEYGISGSALTDENGISGYALTVSGEGKLAVSANQSAISVDNYTQTGCAVTLSGDIDGLIAENNVSISGGSLTTSGAYYGIDTNIGSITISGGTVSSSGEQCGLWAGDAVSITGGTVSASGDDYGIRGYSVSITGGQVTASSGGIRSFGDITLGCTSATDYITASGFTVEEGKHVKIADGQKLYGGGFPSASYTGTVVDPSALNGLMLRPTAAVTESGTNEYTIRYADGWDAFCDALLDNDTYNRFSGKTVKLGDDITVTRMAGSDHHDFCGTFDGGGNTLTFSHTATDNYCAPFRHVQGASAETPAVISNLNVVSTVTADDYRHPAGLIALQSGYVSVTDCNVEAHINCTKGTVNTSELYPAALVSQSNNTGVLTVSGCTTTGQIATDGKYAAGLVGIVQNTATIENCRASVTIQSTTSGDGTHGGIVALNSGTLSINGCVFDGKLLSTGTNATTNCGGFVGYGNGTITNSLYAPADLGTGETEVQTGDVNNHPSATFARDNATVTNSYYTRALGTAQGKQLRTLAAGEGVTLGHDGVATEYSVSGITAYKASDASGDSDPFIAGIIYNNVLYAGVDDEVSLTLTNSAADAPLGYKNGDYSATGGATLSGSTLTMADEDVTVSFTPGDQLRSTGQAVSVSYINADGILCDGQDGRPDPASAIALDGTEGSLGQYGQETWYFVGADISYSDEIYCYDDVNIILADGKTMSVTSDGAGIYGDDGTLTIYGQTLGTGTLDITATNTGIFHYDGNVVICGGTVNATGTYSDGINAYGDITINGGTVNATSTNSAGIKAYGSVTITGGQITATGNEDGICSNNGNITLGWTSASDYITASSYAPGDGKTVNIADGQSLYNGSEVLGIGTVDDYASKLDGKTLVPYIESTTDDGTAILYDNDAGLPDGHRNADRIATLAADGSAHDIMLMGRTLYKDGAWNTLCLPFSVGDGEAESGHELDGTPLEGATLMTLGNSQACNTGFDAQTGTLNLEFLPATTVEPGVAYIVKWSIPDDMTADDFAAIYAANPDAYDLKNPVFTGVTVTNDAPADHATTSDDTYVTFVGTYGPAAIYTDPAVNLYLGAANKLYWPSTDSYRLGAFRAYFQLGNGLTCGDPTNPNAARAFNLNFGDASEETGIREIVTDPTPGPSPAWEGSAGWYTLDGRKLQAQPTKSGLYIHAGKKVVIK